MFDLESGNKSNFENKNNTKNNNGTTVEHNQPGRSSTFNDFSNISLHCIRIGSFPFTGGISKEPPESTRDSRAAGFVVVVVVVVLSFSLSCDDCRLIFDFSFSFSLSLLLSCVSEKDKNQ